MKKILKLVFIISITLFTNEKLSAKENLDSLFVEARKAAINPDNRNSAVEMCQHALALKPNYHDFRVLMGRCYSWDGRYGEAEAEFKYVMNEDSTYIDARNALLDTYIWNKQYVEALDLVVESIFKYPEATEYLQKQVLILENLGRSDEALDILSQVHSDNLEDPNTQLIRYRIIANGVKRSTTLRYAYDRLANTPSEWDFLIIEQSMDPWNFITIEHTENIAWGPLIFKYNYANRFAQTASQLEVESYPLLKKGTYLYTGIGISKSDLFPSLRLGFEVFQALPHAFEVSLGIRHLTFPHNKIPIYVGSVGKYWKSYWINIKSYLSPAQSSLSKSYVVNIRRYLTKSNDYIDIFYSSGVSPDEAIGDQEVEYLNRRGFGINVKYQILAQIDMEFGADFSNQEIRPGMYRGDTGLKFSIIWRY